MINGDDGVLQRSLSQPETAAVVTASSNTQTKPTAISSLTVSTERLSSTPVRPIWSSTKPVASASGPKLLNVKDASVKKVTTKLKIH